ncbi:unnamed protein product, partial [Urochloa humidicola]
PVANLLQAPEDVFTTYSGSGNDFDGISWP